MKKSCSVCVFSGDCFTSNSGFENMCSGYHSLPTVDQVITYFREYCRICSRINLQQRNFLCFYFLKTLLLFYNDPVMNKRRMLLKAAEPVLECVYTYTWLDCCLWLLF